MNGIGMGYELCLGVQPLAGLPGWQVEKVPGPARRPDAPGSPRSTHSKFPLTCAAAGFPPDAANQTPPAEGDASSSPLPKAPPSHWPPGRWQEVPRSAGSLIVRLQRFPRRAPGIKGRDYGVAGEAGTEEVHCYTASLVSSQSRLRWFRSASLPFHPS